MAKKNNVWSILDKREWTKEGVKHMENVHDAIVRIVEKAGIEDLRILDQAIDEHLYSVMDILSEYVRKDGESCTEEV